MDLRIFLIFCNFPAAKIVSDNKIIDKTQTEKDQEYSAHCFGENY